MYIKIHIYIYISGIIKNTISYTPAVFKQMFLIRQIVCDNIFL